MGTNRRMFPTPSDHYVRVHSSVRTFIPLQKAPGLAAGPRCTPPAPLCVRSRATFACRHDFPQTFRDAKQTDPRPQSRPRGPQAAGAGPEEASGSDPELPVSCIFVFGAKSSSRTENKRSNGSCALCTNSPANNADACCVISIQFSAHF